MTSRHPRPRSAFPWSIASVVAALALLGGAFPEVLRAQDTRADEPESEATLLAYLPFDGATPREAARGLETGVLGNGLERIDGRYGGGALFRGGTAVFMPLHIDFRRHPQLTVTAWLRVDARRDADEDFRSGGYVLSTGSGKAGTPEILFRNAKFRATAGTGDKTHHDAGSLPVDEWVHVAGVWDYEARTLRLYVDSVGAIWRDLDGMDPVELADNDRGQPLLEHPTDEERQHEPYVLIGALTFDLGGSLGWVGVDDLRIYSGAMTAEQIRAIRESEDGPADLGDHAIAPPPRREAPEEDEPVAEGGEREDPRGEEGDAEAVDDRGTLVGWTMADDFEISRLSGSSGDQSRTRIEIPDEGFNYLTVSELRDRPCKMAIALADAEGNWGAARDSVAHDPSCRDAAMDYRVRVAAEFRVNAIQVCRNNLNHRLKGVKITARRVELDREAGEVVLRGQDGAEHWQANCGRNEIGEFVSCGRGQLASGLYVHWDQDGSLSSEQVMVGVQLVCRDVVGVYE